MARNYVLKPAFLLGIFIAATIGINAQVINPRISGLRIGSNYREIVKKLGKPLSDKRRGEVPCGDAMRTLVYPGLVLRLEVGGIKPLGLYKIEVSSPKWLVSGLRIGARRSEVLKKFGSEPRFIKDGYAHFHYKRNRLAKMEWEFNFC